MVAGENLVSLAEGARPTLFVQEFCLNLNKFVCQFSITPSCLLELSLIELYLGLGL